MLSKMFVQAKDDGRVLLTVGGIGQSLHVSDFIQVCFRRVEAGHKTEAARASG